MADQFLRKWKLEAGDRSWESDDLGEGLRQEFVIERDEKNVPNNAEIAIYNLNEESREYLETTEELGIRYSAGYGGNFDQIFFGTLRNVESYVEGVNRITRISSGDAEKEFITSTVKKLWKLGTPCATILLDLVKACGVGIGNAPAAAPLCLLGGSPILAGPYAASGGAFDALNVFCRECGIAWSVQGGEFQGAPTGLPSVLTPGPLISPSTGIEGQCSVETTTEKGVAKTVVTCTARLLPQVRPGMAYVVTDQKYDGALKCTSTKHFGDTEGGAWSVEISGEPLISA